MNRIVTLFVSSCFILSYMHAEAGLLDRVRAFKNSTVVQKVKGSATGRALHNMTQSMIGAGSAAAAQVGNTAAAETRCPLIRTNISALQMLLNTDMNNAALDQGIRNNYTQAYNALNTVIQHLNSLSSGVTAAVAFQNARAAMQNVPNLVSTNSNYVSSANSILQDLSL